MNTQANVLETLGITSVHELLALEGLSHASNACAWVGGSVAEGYANAGSDVDIYILDASRPLDDGYTTMGDARSIVRLFGARAVMFEHWSVGAVDKLAARLELLSAVSHGGDHELMEWRMRKDEVSFIHRVRNGIPLTQASRFKELRARFPYDRLATYLCSLKMREIDRVHGDLCGMLDDGQLDVAIPLAQHLVEETCDAYYHHLGGTNTSYKWRPRILSSMRAQVDGRAQTVLSELEEELTSLRYMDFRPLRDAKQAARFIERCIRLAHRITDEILE